MKTWFLRFFFTQLIILLSGYGFLPAHANQESIHFSSSGLSAEQYHDCTDLAANTDHLVIRAAELGGRNKNFKLTEPPYEFEEETESSRKEAKNGHLNFAICVRLFERFSSYNGKISAVYNLYPYTITRRYLILQVFRL